MKGGIFGHALVSRSHAGNVGADADPKQGPEPASVSVQPESAAWAQVGTSTHLASGSAFAISFMQALSSSTVAPQPETGTRQTVVSLCLGHRLYIDWHADNNEPPSTPPSWVSSYLAAASVTPSAP
jgi:hypothetical protein